MLNFSSFSTRIINTRRCVQECVDGIKANDLNDPKVMMVHASIGHDFGEIASEFKELLPDTILVGASCCGVVGAEGVSESMKDMAVMAIYGEEVYVSHENGIYGHNSYEVTKSVSERLKSQNPDINMIYIMASGIDIANDRCIDAIQEIFGENIEIFGATSADNMRGEISYQVVNDEVCQHSIFLVGFADKTIKVQTQATHGFVGIGQPLVVTKAEGNVIKELNGKPAWEEYTNRLGLEKDADCGDTIPIGALGEKLSEDLTNEYGNSLILRVVTKHDGGDMYYATTISEGTELYLTKRDEDLIFNEMDRMVNDLHHRIGDSQIVSVFHADCLARGRFLFNRIIKEELVANMQNPFYQNGKCPPWIGMYGFGEFARLGGKNEYHNYTTALYILYR